MRIVKRMCLLLVLALGVSLPGCAVEPTEGEDDYGIEGSFDPGEPLGKADSAGVKGPWVNNNTRATQVWDARNKWEDVETDAARAAGIAWPADSGLNWDEKYVAWIQAMERQDGNDTYYETFTLTTPWGKSLPAPKLECAEIAIFLRVTFAAWYQLPFYLEARDSKGTRVYFGHFGARTKTSRYKKTPLYGQWYKDYSHYSVEQVSQSWPRDEKLRGRGLYGGGDDMDFIEPGARAGAYFDEIHLNKRVGHFLRLILSYFGSVHLAGSRNTFNLKASALSSGDVLLERWQRRGIGHTLVVKQVTAIDNGMFDAHLVSGSMPRRQPKWEDGFASKRYFTDPRTGGEGESFDGEPYAKLGGGLKRFRVTKNIGGYWTNTWMTADEADWISDTDYEALAKRPSEFDNLLGEISPEQQRDSLIALVEDARNHLRNYPASCAARTKREDAFRELYEVTGKHFGMSTAQTDEAHRSVEDYVFAELEYTQSKTCCWNKTTSAMYEIIMDYTESLMSNSCQAPVVFKCSGGGYDTFAQYAEQTGRGHLWKPWTEDESCSQRDVTDDTAVATDAAPWCQLGAE